MNLSVAISQQNNTSLHIVPRVTRELADTMDAKRVPSQAEQID